MANENEKSDFVKIKYSVKVSIGPIIALAVQNDKKGENTWSMKIGTKKKFRAHLLIVLEKFFYQLMSK